MSRGISADEIRFTDLPRTTEITAKNFSVDQVNSDGVRIDSLEAPSIDLVNTPGADMVVYSDKLRVAKIESGSATLGSLNIGGVRLTITQGRGEARWNDIEAGEIALAKTETFPAGGKLDTQKIYNP